ncbi:MAG TPA: hypothetical protein VJN44_00775, partial [Roseateles sp.]|nr:hypothetical protein [Roseateles sp.]
AAAGGGGVGIPNLQMVKDMWNLGIASPTGYKPLSSMPTLIWHKAEVIKYLLYLTNQAPAV